MLVKQESPAWSFEKVSKNEWLDKVRADLKGRAYEELVWQINDRLHIEPLYVSGESNPAGEILSGPSGWCAVQSVPLEDIDRTNAALLEALELGAEGIWLGLPSQQDIQKLSGILEGVHLGYINIYMSVGFSLTDETLNAIQAELGKCKGHEDMQVYLEDIQEPSVRPLAENGKLHPVGFRWNWQHGDWDDLDISLARLLAEVNATIDNAPEGNRRSLINQMHFTVALGDSYFIEVARLRALRSVLKNLLAAWELSTDQIPHILAITDLESYEEDPYQNMIRAASIGMSGAVGGADALFIHPGDAASPTELEFASRVSLNVQHLMKMESHIDKVRDPAAGSYYIETLTRNLGESAWGEFRKLA